MPKNSDLFFTVGAGLFGAAIGAALTYYYKSSPSALSGDLRTLSESDPQAALRVVTDALPGDSEKNKRVAEAAVVRLTDHVTMQGATIRDTVSREVENDQLRDSVQVTPYPWTAAGASCVPIYIKGDQYYFLMVHNKRRDAEKPVLRLPEGYMHPQARPSSFSKSATRLQSDHRDNAEEMLLKDKPPTLLHARDLMRRAYSQQPKGSLQDVNAEHDVNLFDTAVRELQEEVGLAVPKESLKMTHSNFGRQGFVPVIEAEVRYCQVVTEFPEARPDGVEIDDVVFVQAKGLERTHDKGYSYQHSTGTTYSIPEKYALMLDGAMKAHEQELEATQKKKFAM